MIQLVRVEKGACEHARFRITGAAVRLHDESTDGPETGFAIRVRAECDNCRLPFVFDDDDPIVRAGGHELLFEMQPGQHAAQA